MRGRRRADVAKQVRARRGHRNPRPPNQFQRHRMRRHPHPHQRPSRRHRIRHRRRPRQQQRQRPRPEGLHQLARRLRNLLHQPRPASPHRQYAQSPDPTPAAAWPQRSAPPPPRPAHSPPARRPSRSAAPPAPRRAKSPPPAPALLAPRRFQMAGIHHQSQCLHSSIVASARRRPVCSIAAQAAPLALPYTHCLTMPVETEIKFRVDDLAALSRASRPPASPCKPRAPSSATFSTTLPTATCAPAPKFCASAPTPAAALLTHKRLPDVGPGEDTHKHRIETETEVSDGEALAQVFLSLGLVPAFRYEKWRTEWPTARATASSMKPPSATTPSSKVPPNGSTAPPPPRHRPRRNTSPSATAASSTSGARSTTPPLPTSPSPLLTGHQLPPSTQQGAGNFPPLALLRSGSSPSRGTSYISSRCRRGKVVAPHLLARPPLRRLARISAARHARRLQLALLLALELLLQRVDRRRRLPRVNPNLARLRVQRRPAAPRSPPAAPWEPAGCLAEPHPSAGRPAPESASGTGTAPCPPGTSASSLRTCRTTPACTPPADPAAHSRAARCPSFRWSIDSR